MRKNSKRKIAATIAITAILVGGGGAAAIAYWSAGGAGTGVATTATSASIVVNQGSPISNLAPGAAAQTLSGTFTNLTGASIFVNTVTASISTITPAVGAVGTCAAADYSLLNPTVTIAAQVPAGSTVGSWTGPTIQFKNSTTLNQDGCKGATVNIAYAIS